MRRLATGALVVAIVALVGVLVNALNTFFLGRVLRKEIQAAQMEVNKAAV